MYDAIRYGTAVYRNELAKQVQQIGYRIQPSKHGFQIEGVSDEVLKRFSKRAAQRDAVVQELELLSLANQGDTISAQRSAAFTPHHQPKCQWAGRFLRLMSLAVEAG